MIPFSPRLAILSAGVLVLGSTGYFGYDFWTSQALLLRRLESLEAQISAASLTASRRVSQEETVESLPVSIPTSATEVDEVMSSDGATTAAQELAAARQEELSEARETIGLLTRQIAELQQSLQESQAQQATLALRDQQLLEMRTRLEAALTARSSAPTESAPAALPHTPSQPIEDGLVAAAAPMSATTPEPTASLASAVPPPDEAKNESAPVAPTSATEIAKLRSTAKPETEVMPATGVATTEPAAGSPSPILVAPVVTNEPRTVEPRTSEPAAIERTTIKPQEAANHPGTQQSLTASPAETRRVDATTTARTMPAAPSVGPVRTSPSIRTEIAGDINNSLFDDSGWRSSWPTGGF
jgi:hypothetical protein